MEKAILAGGCFWCVEAVFKPIKGVQALRSGYIGGRRANPSYEQICTGTTGHAEAVEIEFDPAIVSFDTVLDVFFATHDPTTLNRQGNDVGTQYRSAIFYTSEAQKSAAAAAIERAAKLWDDAIVTEVTAAGTFYPAEDYHQDYYADNPRQPYCQMIVAPKVKKARQGFAHLMAG
ncbi:MAG: peptide-methionine (S)-S-oxide reductase [Alphaproteobacteria bacterium]|nr:peptide-methionine (S)-S-oxide reductase [Alphaproteobacteria bacterium]